MSSTYTGFAPAFEVSPIARDIPNTIVGKPETNCKQENSRKMYANGPTISVKRYDWAFEFNLSRKVQQLPNFHHQHRNGGYLN